MSIQSEINRIITAVSDQEALIGEIVDALAERCVVTEPLLQARTVTPTKDVQVVTPDAGYDGLSSVTVEAAQGGEGTYGWKKCVSRLPSGYTEVEYLESSGTQYINTGVIPATNMRAEVDFQWNAIAANSWLTVFGSRTSSGSQDQFNITTDTGNSYAGFASQELTLTTPFNVVGKRYTVALDKNSVTVNGVTAGTYRSGLNVVSNYPMYIFGRNNAGGFGNGFTGRIYSLKLYVDGALSRHYVPCKNASGTTGMYDIVKGVFYANAGSGTFATGASTGGVVVGYVVSDDANAYPDGAFLDGYYYEKLAA